MGCEVDDMLYHSPVRLEFEEMVEGRQVPTGSQAGRQHAVGGESQPQTISDIMALHKGFVAVGTQWGPIKGKRLFVLKGQI